MGKVLIVLSVLFVTFSQSSTKPIVWNSETERTFLRPSRSLLQSTEEDSAATSAAAPLNCSVIFESHKLSIKEGTLLEALESANTIVCCNACAKKSGCTTWRRNRENGDCELLSVIRAQTYESEETDANGFDLGGFVGPIIASRKSRSRTRAPEPPCQGTRGVTYPKGVNTVADKTVSQSACCRICRSVSDCCSWYYNRKTELCVLNENIPPVRRGKASRYYGGTV